MTYSQSHNYNTITHNTQTVNAAAATIEAFVERRQHVLLEVIESLMTSFPKIQNWNVEKNINELIDDPMKLRFGDKIKKYAMSIPFEQLNQQPTLLGDVLKGVLDIVKHVIVST